MVAFLPEIVELVVFADFPPAEASSPSSSGRIADTGRDPIPFIKYTALKIREKKSFTDKKIKTGGHTAW